MPERYTGFDILDLLGPPAAPPKRRPAAYTSFDPLDIMGPPAAQPILRPGPYTGVGEVFGGPPLAPPVKSASPYTGVGEVFAGPPMAPPVAPRNQGYTGFSPLDIMGPPIPLPASRTAVPPDAPQALARTAPVAPARRGTAKRPGEPSPALDYSIEELFGAAPQAEAVPGKIPALPQDQFSPEAEKAIMAQAEKAGELGPLGILGVILGETGASIAKRGSIIPIVEAERERRRQAIIGPYLAQKAQAAEQAKEQRRRDFEESVLGRKQTFEAGESEKDRALRKYLGELGLLGSQRDAEQRAADRAADRALRAGDRAADRALRAGDRADARAAAEAGRAERSQDNLIARFANKVEASGLAGSIPAMENVEQLLAKADAAGGGIPGYGVVAGLVPNFLSTEAGQEFRQAVQQLANMRLKARSGSAVTDSEYWRFVQELAGGKLVPEERIRQGIKQMRAELESTAKNLKGIVSKDALAEYHARVGDPGLAKWLGGGAEKASPSGQLGPYDDPEKEARFQEYAKKHGQQGGK